MQPEITEIREHTALFDLIDNHLLSEQAAFDKLCMNGCMIVYITNAIIGRLKFYIIQLADADKQSE